MGGGGHCEPSPPLPPPDPHPIPGPGPEPQKSPANPHPSARPKIESSLLLILPPFSRAGYVPKNQPPPPIPLAPPAPVLSQYLSKRPNSPEDPSSEKLSSALILSRSDSDTAPLPARCTLSSILSLSRFLSLCSSSPSSSSSSESHSWKDKPSLVLTRPLS